jgi:hypothetical protein
MRSPHLDLKRAIDSAKAIIDIRKKLSALRFQDANASDDIRSLVDLALRLTEEADEPNSLRSWRMFIAGLRLMENLVRCQTLARLGGGDLIAEASRTKFLSKEFHTELEYADLNSEKDAIAMLNTILYDPDELRRRLLISPLPSLYLRKRTKEQRYQQRNEENSYPQWPLVRVIAFLDDAPIASPQLLRSELIYSVRFKMKGLQWPSMAKRLRLDLLTTCPTSEFAISEFSAIRPPLQEDGGFEVEVCGQLKFRSGQSNLLDDLVFATQVAFVFNEDEAKEVPAIGHTQLRLRVTDENRQPLITGNRSLDRHISELAMALVRGFPTAKDELPQLLPMLEALTRLLATYAQESVYKGQTNVKEAEFQKLVLRDLRNMLGQDVQERVGQAGGFTDIRYRGVIVELKVESTNADRDFLAKNFTPQATQYAGVEARQVSILLVLDLTEKVRPPGDIRNDIRLFDVVTHEQGNCIYPSKAFLFVVNGNTRSPSSYS